MPLEYADELWVDRMRVIEVTSDATFEQVLMQVESSTFQILNVEEVLNVDGSFIIILTCDGDGRLLQDIELNHGSFTRAFQGFRDGFFGYF